MRDPHDPADLTAHALGLLDDIEAAAVERHLDGCAACRREWDELRETSNLLGDVPPEMFLDGLPDGDLVLQRALWQVRAENRAVTGRRRLAMAAAAVVAVLALAGGGLVVGRVTAADATLAQPDTAASGQQPGSRTVEGSRGPVEVSAVLTPAVGWVRVAATVRGVPAGTRCMIVVVDDEGREKVAGSWLSSASAAARGTTVHGSAIVSPEDVAELRISSEEGEEYISLPV